MDRQDVERRILDHQHQAATLRQNPPPREAEERRRRADQLDHEAELLHRALQDHLRAERATNEAARNADQVIVRFVRDLPADALVDNVTVAAARGPLKQRQTRRDHSSGHPLGTVGVEVELQPGEVRELPGAVAAVLLDGGYVRVLTDAEELERARAELAAAKRQGR